MQVRTFGSIAVFIVAVGGILSGCGGTGDRSQYGNWTLKESLTVDEDLRLTGTEAYYFGQIVDLDVTSEGQMVVADREANHLKILQPDGTLADTLGRKGGGPGEFRQLIGVQVARGDSIYAFDARQSRITVFGAGASRRMSRNINIPRERGYPVQVQVLDESFAAEFGSMSPPEEGVSRPSPRTWMMMGPGGVPKDTVLHTPGNLMLRTQTGEGGFRVQFIPQTPRTATAWGPGGRLYYGWTDSLHVDARRPGGSTVDIAHIPTQRVPLTEAGRDSLLSDYEGKIRTRMASALPDTRPAFSQIVVAQSGRLWAERPPEQVGADRTPWWVLNPAEKTIQKVRLPSEVDLEVVQNGHAYGTITTETGAPALVRYGVES